jgi:hypothetical protein
LVKPGVFVALIHTNEKEAEQRAEQLRRAGFKATHLSTRAGASALRPLRDTPPAAIVIDLCRSPSHALEVGTSLRQQRATRNVALVFLGGAPDKVRRVQGILPDAAYGDWEDARAVILEAIAAVPDRPVVPPGMAGYSGTPLPKKLGIKAGTRLALVGAPDGFRQTLGDALAAVSVAEDLRRGADMIILFVKSRAELSRRLPSVMKAMVEAGNVWIAWPKRTSGLQTDLGESEVRQTGLEAGLVDFKICAIDPIWSGLRFSRRRGKTS